jgi:hypothetical protein
MNRRNIFSLSVIAALGLASLPGSAVSQQKTLKDQLVGAWMLVSIDNIMPDGKKQQLFGTNPNGILILDVSGRFAQVQMPANRPKFKSANRLEATAEESTAAMHTSLAQFGTWSVSEVDKTIITRNVGALIPNAEGMDGKRIITSLTPDELRLTNPGPSTGGKNETVYRRAKYPLGTN